MFCCSWQDVKTWMPSICTSPELAVILGAGTPALCVNRGLGFVTEKAVFLLCKNQGLFCFQFHVELFFWGERFKPIASMYGIYHVVWMVWERFHDVSLMFLRGWKF